MNLKNKHRINENYGYVIFMIIITVFINLNIVSAASISDPTGDFPFPDVTKLDVNTINNRLIIKITHAENVFDSLGLKTSAGIIFIDTDQKYKTGIKNIGNGADFKIDYTVNAYFILSNLYDSHGDSTDIGPYVNVDNKQIIFSIPLSLLGNDNGKVNIVVATRADIWIGSTFDRAPDYGVLNTGSNKVEVPFPGNKLAGGVIIDKKDSGYPDITKVNVSTYKGNLNIIITYKENLIDNSISKGAYAFIHLDTDQSLATGFTNTGENPPTFGVDYRIYYDVASVMGTPSASIEYRTGSDMTKMESAGIGIPDNDGTFKYSGNKIFLNIPLGLLKFDEGNLYLHIFSYDLNLQSADNIPDYGKGALNTFNGKLKLPISCINYWKTIQDPSNDSLGFGYDGDEITAVKTCNAIGSIIENTAHKTLVPDDQSATNVYFDIDQNPNTGIKISNEANTIGAEYMVASNYDDYGIFHTYLNNLNKASIKEVNQLGIPVGSKSIITVPLKMIGNNGAVDMLVQTYQPALQLEYDIAPNSGIIRLDITPPKSVTNLKNITYKRNYINWIWTNPTNSDFSKVMIYINGKFKTNVYKPKRNYNLTGLNRNTLYKVSTHTVDVNGNINQTWVNKIARTAP